MFVPHPPEQRDLVAQPEVALERASARAVPREVEVAERAEPVVEAHVHDPPAAHESLALTREVTRGARAVSAAVDEHHDRQGATHPTSRTGACTFTLRQSSSAAMTLIAGRTSRITCAWGAIAPNADASRMPRHGTTGAGALNRRSPIGGAAYGMPRQASISPSRTPRTTPPVTRTSSPSSVPGCAVMPARISSPHSIPVAPAPPEVSCRMERRADAAWWRHPLRPRLIRTRRPRRTRRGR